MGHAFRAILTGSRDYDDRELVNHTVALLAKTAEQQGRKLVVVHGACPTGADKYAHDAAVALGVGEESHPAAFAELGPSAGPRRNAEMARAGAEVCLAFCHTLTRGTASMISEATRARIPVFIVQPSLPLREIVFALMHPR